jgi:hypothetical protein
MSPILGIYASQISGHLVTNSYASIATQTVGSGGASSITFSSIPSTYTHLQVRFSWSDSTSGIANSNLSFNSDSSSNYAWHYLNGDGSSASSGYGLSRGAVLVGQNGGSGNSNKFSTAIVDILDYTNINKNKVTRTLTGYDNNGSGGVFLVSGLYLGGTIGNSSNTITSLTLSPTSNFVQYTTAALYGVK